MTLTKHHLALMQDSRNDRHRPAMSPAPPSRQHHLGTATYSWGHKGGAASGASSANYRPNSANYQSRSQPVLSDTTSGAATRPSPGTCRLRKYGCPIAEDRFVVCFNPDQAVRDAAIRARMIAQLKELINGLGQLSKDKRAELRGVISTKPGLNRYLRVTPGGLLRVDAAKAKAEENLDGKYLLRTPTRHLSAEDIAAGYKQLLEVERGWRDMKSGPRPAARLPPQGRAHPRPRHPLLARPAPRPRRREPAGQTWPAMRRDLQRIAIGTFTGPAGTFRQRTDIPKTARDLLTTLKIDVPRKIHELTTPEA
jgi:hypothetical protein